MINLLKTDLIRVFKDKLFLVLGIIGVAFALVTPITSRIMLFVLELDPSDVAEIVPMTAKSMFFSSFSLSNNFGLIVPILVTIILCKDFSHGTIRNKIICGNRRWQIFLSLFISGTVAMFAAILAHALLTLGVSVLLFKYQAEPFTASDLGYFLLSVLFEAIVYAYVASITAFLCAWAKNSGVAIVCFIAILLISTLVGSISTMALMLIIPEENEAVYNVWNFLSRINIFVNAQIGNGRSYSTEDVLYILLPPLCFGAITVLSGLFIFNKKDLK